MSQQENGVINVQLLHHLQHQNTTIGCYKLNIEVMGCCRPQNGSARRRMVERGYVCIPQVEGFVVISTGFPCFVLVVGLLGRTHGRMLCTSTQHRRTEEDKKDLGGRTHTDDEGVYGHSITRHDGRGRRLDFVPSVCKRRGSLTPAHPWVSPSPLPST